jgi:5,10-methylenetetrahydromethanopterin reductase
MRIGIFDGDHGDVATVVEGARAAESQGFDLYVIPQIFRLDALTALAVAGTQVPRIELATGVVPIWTRHPMMLAAQARTVHNAIGGRLTLGIGLAHQVVVEAMLGMPWERPAHHMEEYLRVLLPLLRDGTASVAGEVYTFHGAVDVDAEPVPVLLAALAPRMLRLAGGEADGTATWMTGPRTLAEHVVPSITRAAEAAGRPAPRVVTCLPVMVTDDAAAARGRAAQAFSVYATLPSYRAMLDREGVDGPADVAIVGTEAEVEAEVRALADAGVTDFVAAEFAPRDQADRTRELLRSLL